MVSFLVSFRYNVDYIVFRLSPFLLLIFKINMRTLYVLGLCLVVVFADIDPQTKKKLDEINKSPFGKTIFETINMQLGTSEPLDSLLKTLTGIEDSYQNDQKEDDSSNNSFQQYCDSDLDGLTKDIAENERKKVELQGVIDQLKPVLSERNGQLSAKEQLRKALQGEIDGIDNQRQEENNEYESKRQEMQLVVSVINEAKHIFQNAFGGSFLQGSQVKPETLSEINTHFAKVATTTGKQRFGKAFSHIFKFLASMTSANRNHSPELAEKILKLCDQLLDKVDESWDTERKAEDQRVTVYQAYKKLLQKDLNQYNSQIANLQVISKFNHIIQTEISSLSDRLNSTQNSLDDVSQRISDKNTRKDDRRNECQEAAYDYQQRRTQRQTNMKNSQGQRQNHPLYIDRDRKHKSEISQGVHRIEISSRGQI